MFSNLDSFAIHFYNVRRPQFESPHFSFGLLKLGGFGILSLLSYVSSFFRRCAVSLSKEEIVDCRSSKV